MDRLSPQSPKSLVTDVVVCARDCAASLAGLLSAVPMREVRSVVVVDCGSLDGTAQVARDAGAVVLRELQGGYGAACLRAQVHLGGLPRPPDVVVFLPAGTDCDPAAISALLAPIQRGAELVIGMRTGGGHQRGNRVMLSLIGAIYRHRFADLSPLRAIRFPALVAMGMSDRGAGWDVEMQVKAVKLGLHIEEVPVARVVGEDTAPAARGAADTARSAASSVESTGRMLFQILRHATTR